MEFKPTGREIPLLQADCSPRFLLFNRLIAAPCELISANVDKELARSFVCDFDDAFVKNHGETVRLFTRQDSSGRAGITFMEDSARG